ncbi:MAG: cytochrome c oxidase accessory protein CcoG [Spirosomataceae bacterium]
MSYIDEYLADTESYRDSIATVDAQGKRIWLYPLPPKGPYFTKRIWATIGFLAVFLAGPWIKIQGQPLLMFNIFERKFVILGQLFLPQDFILFGLGMIIFVIFIALFTVTFGRIWCGWLCPQTVFMEMIFRPIEYALEGSGRQQKKLDDGPWTMDKIVRKSIKHAIFLLFSILIAHVTMAYLIGIDQVIQIVQTSPAENWKGFLGLLAFTGIFYFVFSRLREQVCVAICPYGRLQGVLVNEDTLNVIYDDVRGEPRGKITKGDFGSTPKGDCIDCKLCVQVCPTGIDIRNGIQLECVNCTACIDACDTVMEKIERPKGLIRYSSVNAIKKNKPFTFTSRAKAYSAILLVLVSLEGYLLWSRTEIESTLLRVPGQLYQETNRGTFTNLYNVQMVNKTNDEQVITLHLVEPTGILKTIDGSTQFKIAPGSKKEVVFFIEVPKEDIKTRKTEVELEVKVHDRVVETLTSNFVGPL